VVLNEVPASQPSPTLSWASADDFRCSQVPCRHRFHHDLHYAVWSRPVVLAPMVPLSIQMLDRCRSGDFGGCRRGVERPFLPQGCVDAVVPQPVQGSAGCRVLTSIIASSLPFLFCFRGRFFASFPTPPSHPSNCRMSLRVHVAWGFTLGFGSGLMGVGRPSGHAQFCNVLRTLRISWSGASPSSLLSRACYAGTSRGWSATTQRYGVCCEVSVRHMLPTRWTFLPDGCSYANALQSGGLP